MKTTTRSLTRFARRSGAVAVAACFSIGLVHALPTNPTVVNGSANFAQSGNTLTVTNSNGAIINWQQFSIAAGQTTQFQQASSASSVLNRVIGGNLSSIYGTLSSNGRVWLVNPAGIMVGPTGRVDVASFVASTLNVTNADFLANRLNFGVAGSVAMAGNVTIEDGARITTPDGGSVYLVGANVSNAGVITTPKGEAILAAGNTVQLIDTATPGVKVEITGSEGNATNLGEISAQAGRIGIGGVIVRNSGVLNASSAVEEGGRIFLKASQDAYVDGAGRIVTTGTKGGSIDVLGNRVAVMDNAVLDASGTGGGGSIRVGGDYQGKNPDVQNAQITYFGADATLKVNATEVGAGGTAIVWADDTTRAYGTIEAKGGAVSGNGGFVETSGKRYLETYGIRVNTGTADGMAGQWLLDPMFLYISEGTDPYGGPVNNDPTYNIFGTSGSTYSQIFTTDIETALATGNVTIQSGGRSCDTCFTYGGNIDMNSASIEWGTATSLTLIASGSEVGYGNVSFYNSSISNTLTTGTRELKLIAGWDGVSSVTSPSIILGTGNISVKNSLIGLGTSSLKARAGNDIDVTYAPCGECTPNVGNAGSGTNFVTLTGPAGTFYSGSFLGSAGTSALDVGGNINITNRNGYDPLAGYAGPEVIDVRIGSIGDQTVTMLGSGKSINVIGSYEDFYGGSVYGGTAILGSDGVQTINFIGGGVNSIVIDARGGGAGTQTTFARSGVFGDTGQNIGFTTGGGAELNISLYGGTLDTIERVARLGSVYGNQSITATHLTLDAGATGIYGNAYVFAQGTQTLNLYGDLTLYGGGSGAGEIDKYALIKAGATQEINMFASGAQIALYGGAGNGTDGNGSSNNFASIEAGYDLASDPGGYVQQIHFLNGGNLSLYGGSVGTHNFANVWSAYGQRIDGTPDVLLDGGISGGGTTDTSVSDGGRGNDAGIFSGDKNSGTGFLSLGDITLIGGSADFGGAGIGGWDLNITSSGNVYLEGGQSSVVDGGRGVLRASTPAFIGIDQASTGSLTLNVTGNLEVFGGTGSQALATIGSLGASASAVSITVGGYADFYSTAGGSPIVVGKGLAEGLSLAGLSGIFLGGNISVTGDLYLSADTGNVVQRGTLATGGATYLSAGCPDGCVPGYSVEVGGDISASDIFIDAGGAILDSATNGTMLGNLYATNSIYLYSQFGGNPGALAISADTQTAGTINAVVDASAANGGIRISNQGSSPSVVTLSDSSASGGSMTLRQVGDLTAAVTLYNPLGSASLSASGVFGLSGASIDATNISISGNAVDIQSSTLSGSGDVNIASATTLSLTGATLYAGTTPGVGSIKLTAGGAISSDSGTYIDAYGNTVIDAGGSLALGGTVFGGTVTLKGASMVVTGDVYSDGDTLITSGSDFSLNGGTIYASGGTTSDVSVTANGALLLGGGGSVYSNGSALLAAGGLFQQTGGFIFGGTGVGIAGADIVLGGAIESAGGDVTVASSSSIAMSGASVYAGTQSIGNANFVAAGNISLSNGTSVIAYDDITLALTGATSVLSLNSGSYLIADYSMPAPATIYVDMPGLASGGFMVDGVAVPFGSFASTPGGMGFFTLDHNTPAAFGSTLLVAYGAVAPVAIDPVTNALNSATSAASTTSTPLDSGVTFYGFENGLSNNLLDQPTTGGGGGGTFGSEGEGLEDDGLDGKKRYGTCGIA